MKVKNRICFFYSKIVATFATDIRVYPGGLKVPARPRARALHALHALRNHQRRHLINNPLILIIMTKIKVDAIVKDSKLQSGKAAKSSKRQVYQR